MARGVIRFDSRIYVLELRVASGMASWARRDVTAGQADHRYDHALPKTKSSEIAEPASGQALSGRKPGSRRRCPAHDHAVYARLFRGYLLGSLDKRLRRY